MIILSDKKKEMIEKCVIMFGEINISGIAIKKITLKYVNYFYFNFSNNGIITASLFFIL